MDDIVRTERRGAVAIMTLNRSEAMNALSIRLETALRETLDNLLADNRLRAIVLTGAGRAFCAGVDLKELGTDAGKAGRVWHGRDCLAAIMRGAPKPLIAAVNGHAITGGLELALNCDFIIAAETAKFADTHARVGITPSWGLSQILPRRIGTARALQMSLTGTFVDAATAAAWGLANEVVASDALLPRAIAIGEEMAETDPGAMGRIRQLMQDGTALPLPEALAMEAAVFDEHMAIVTPASVEARRGAIQARGQRLSGAKS
ncbi:MAG: enoyl-CoA hydratase [Pseudomonadota bacterium]